MEITLSKDELLELLKQQQELTKKEMTARANERFVKILDDAKNYPLKPVENYRYNFDKEINQMYSDTKYLTIIPIDLTPNK